MVGVSRKVELAIVPLFNLQKVHTFKTFSDGYKANEFELTN